MQNSMWSTTLPQKLQFSLFIFGLVCLSKGSFIMWNVQQNEFCTQSSPLFPIQPHSFQSVPIPQASFFQGSQPFCFGIIPLENWVIKSRAALWSHTIRCCKIFKTAVQCSQKTLGREEGDISYLCHLPGWFSPTNLQKDSPFREVQPKVYSIYGCSQKMSWNMLDTFCSLHALPKAK